MKCRIIKRDGKFLAQYLSRKFFHGRHTRCALAWDSLKDGAGIPILFETDTTAECALRDYANNICESTVVKEFEV